MRSVVRRKLLFLLILLVAFGVSSGIAQDAGRGSIFISGYSDLVFGFDTFSRGTGVEVFGAVQVGYTFNEDPDASTLGDRSVTPHVEFRIKDITASASGDWGPQSSASPLRASATFDWARLVFGDFFLKLYGSRPNTFNTENVSSFYSVRRKQVQRLGTEDNEGSFRNLAFHNLTNLGLVGAPTGNVFSIGYNNPFIGNFELFINSANSWRNHSQWGGVEPYLDNRNAYTLGLNGRISAIMDLTLDFQFRGGIGYLIKDTNNAASNTLSWGLAAAYRIPLGSGLALIPRLGADFSFIRDLYPDTPFKFVGVFSDDPANFNFALGGAVQLQWPGPFDLPDENLFFGRQKVFSGATVSFRWNPDQNEATDNMHLGISVWEPSGTLGILPIPMGFALALEMSNFTKWDTTAKADLMGYVDVSLGAQQNIRPYIGFNYAFLNAENSTMDSATQYFDSNVLDFELGVRVSDFVFKADAFFQYRTGEMLPQPGEERNWGVITTGLSLRF